MSFHASKGNKSLSPDEFEPIGQSQKLVYMGRSLSGHRGNLHIPGDLGPVFFSSPLIISGSLIIESGTYVTLHHPVDAKYQTNGIRVADDIICESRLIILGQRVPLIADGAIEGGDFEISGDIRALENIKANYIRCSQSMWGGGKITARAGVKMGVHGDIRAGEAVIAGFIRARHITVASGATSLVRSIGVDDEAGHGIDVTGTVSCEKGNILSETDIIAGMLIAYKATARRNIRAKRIITTFAEAGDEDKEGQIAAKLSTAKIMRGRFTKLDR